MDILSLTLMSVKTLIDNVNAKVLNDKVILNDI